MTVGCMYKQLLLNYKLQTNTNALEHWKNKQLYILSLYSYLCGDLKAQKIIYSCILTLQLSTLRAVLSIPYNNDTTTTLTVSRLQTVYGDVSSTKIKDSEIAASGMFAEKVLNHVYFLISPIHALWTSKHWLFSTFIFHVTSYCRLSPILLRTVWTFELHSYN